MSSTKKMNSILGSSCTSRPLGMTDGSIKDWQLAASSALSRADDPQCAVKFARLHQQDGKAWCAAKKAVNEWLLVDLGVASEVSGIVTQGRGDVTQWVTHFMVSYSLDAYKWEFARDIYGNKKVNKSDALLWLLPLLLSSGGRRRHGLACIIIKILFDRSSRVIVIRTL